jgi:hypothetical protein
MIIFPLLVSMILSPYYPDPGYPDPNDLTPTYIVNGDGSRMQCTPGGLSCWPYTVGLPTYAPQGG